MQFIPFIQSSTWCEKTCETFHLPHGALLLAINELEKMLSQNESVLKTISRAQNVLKLSRKSIINEHSNIVYDCIVKPIKLCSQSKSKSHTRHDIFRISWKSNQICCSLSKTINENVQNSTVTKRFDIKMNSQTYDSS